MKCDRCGKETTTHTVSMFNTDDICVECKAKERAHPMYETARQADYEAIKKGIYNFKGIGKPDDL